MSETSDDAESERAGASAGWTNEHVREGFDVDGADSRTVPMRMETRVELNRMASAVLGPALRWLLDGLYRPSYPLLRRVGDRFGKGRFVEQYVAEKEYIAEAVQDGERYGVGSRGWFGGLALLAGLVLFGFGGGFAAGTVLLDLGESSSIEVLPGAVLSIVGVGLVGTVWVVASRSA